MTQWITWYFSCSLTTFKIVLSWSKVSQSSSKISQNESKNSPISGKVSKISKTLTCRIDQPPLVASHHSKKLVIPEHASPVGIFFLVSGSACAMDNRFRSEGSSLDDFRNLGESQVPTQELFPDLFNAGKSLRKSLQVVHSCGWVLDAEWPDLEIRK